MSTKSTFPSIEECFYFYFFAPLFWSNSSERSKHRYLFFFFTVVTLSPAFRPRERDARFFLCPLRSENKKRAKVRSLRQELKKQQAMQTRSETVAGTAEASAESVFASARKPLTLAGLPNHLLSSIFAQENRQLYEKKRFWQSPEGPTWVRHTFPLFCTSWSELYRSLNASLLHEMLQLDVWKEVVATRAREGGGGILLALVLSTLRGVIPGPGGALRRCVQAWPAGTSNLPKASARRTWARSCVREFVFLSLLAGERGSECKKREREKKRETELTHKISVAKTTLPPLSLVFPPLPPTRTHIDAFSHAESHPLVLQIETKGTSASEMGNKGAGWRLVHHKVFFF